MSNDTPKQTTDEQVKTGQSNKPAVPAHLELVEAILSQLEKFFSGRMAELFESADKHFFQYAKNAKDSAEQGRYYDFMNTLRKQRSDIVNHFFSELNQYLKPVAACKELPKKQSQAKISGLSLMNQDEMDELIALTTLSGKVAADCRQELTMLAERLEYLATLNGYIFHPQSLDPHNICDAFQKSLASSELVIQNKLELYKVFGVEVIKQLNQLYAELNSMMIRAGILPDAEFSGKILRNARDHIEDPLHHLPPAAERFTAAQLAGPLGRGGQTGGYYSSAEATAQVIDATAALGQILQSIAGFVGGNPATADISGGAGADPAAYYTRKDVVSALSGLQNVVNVSPDAPLQFDANALKKAVLASIGERSGGVVDKRVNQISEKTIDFIKLIFDAIIEDRGINDTIKSLLLSLQIPIIKAAMLDESFFVDDQHPARQLLDRIAEAGVGVSDHNDEVYIELHAIVKKLLNDYNEDVTAFSVALDAIKALTDRIYEQARNTEKQSKEQVQHTHARNVVLQEIRKITIGKELAPGIRILVLKIWPSLMFNHYLRFGKSNDEWVEMLMILAKIIESVQLQHSKAEFEEMGLSYEDIIHSATEKLKKCRKSESVIEQAIKDLRDTYREREEQRAAIAAKTPKVVTPVAPPVAATAFESTAVPVKPVSDVVVATATTKEVLATDAAPIVAQAEMVGGTAVEMAADQDSETPAEAEITSEQAARAKLAKLPADVQPGAWFIVYNGENRPVRRLKLAVILMQDATMVFVDHLGNVVIEKDVEVFAEELERGASGVIMQHSVFDHALRSALEAIQR